MLIKNNPGKIKVVGIGNAGNQAINSLIESGNTNGVDFIGINRKKDLKKNPNKEMILFKDSSKFSSSENLSSYWESIFPEYESSIEEKIINADILFIVCGEGKDYSTTIAPLVAQIAKRHEILTIAVVTKPFLFEGKKRMSNAENGIQELEKVIDTLITIPLQKLFAFPNRKSGLKNAFNYVYTTLQSGVTLVLDIITRAEFINIDLADIRTVMKNAGVGYIGEGNSKNNDFESVEKAMKEAINSPLVEGSVKDARKIIVNITGGTELSMHAINNAIEKLKSKVDQEADIFFGLTFDVAFTGKVKVCVIATDFATSIFREPLELNNNKEAPNRFNNFTLDI